MELKLSSIFRLSVALFLALLVVLATCQWLLSNKSFGFDKAEYNQRIHQIEASKDIEEIRKHALASTKVGFTVGNLIASILRFTSSVSLFLGFIVLVVCVLSYKAKKNISNKKG